MNMNMNYIYVYIDILYIDLNYRGYKESFSR